LKAVNEEKSTKSATWPQELLDSQIYRQRHATDEIFVPLLMNTGHFLIVELGDYDYRGITAVVNSIPRRPHYRAAP